MPSATNKTCKNFRCKDFPIYDTINILHVQYHNGEQKNCMMLQYTSKFLSWFGPSEGKMAIAFSKSELHLNFKAHNVCLFRCSFERLCTNPAKTNITATPSVSKCRCNFCISPIHCLQHLYSDKGENGYCETREKWQDFISKWQDFISKWPIFISKWQDFIAKWQISYPSDQFSYPIDRISYPSNRFQIQVTDFISKRPIFISNWQDFISK